MKHRQSRAIGSLALINWILIGLAVFAFILSPLSCYDGKAAARKTADLSHLKQSALANLIYMADHDGYGPPPDQWMDLVAPYLRNEWSSNDDVERVYTSPGFDRDGGEYGYAYLRELGGVRLEDVLNPQEVPLLFNSSDLGRNVAGGLDLLPDPPRWDSGNNFAFLDSHAKHLDVAPQFTIELP